jgi:hypothetical protein
MNRIKMENLANQVKKVNNQKIMIKDLKLEN